MCVFKSWALWILLYAPSVVRNLPSEKCNFVRKTRTVSICDNTHRNFYMSVTILFFCPHIEPFLCLQLTCWHVIQIAVHTNYVYSPFPGALRIKSSPTWYMCCVHLQEQQELVQFIAIEAQRFGLKRGKWRQNVQVGFYVRAFIWSWRDNDKYKCHVDC